MINWYDNNVMMSIWHKMYVNSLRTVQSAYSRLFDDNDSKFWWWLSHFIWCDYGQMINMKHITFIIDDMMMIFYIMYNVMNNMYDFIHRAAHMSTFNTSFTISILATLLLLLSLSRAPNIFILAPLITLLIDFSTLLSATGSWQKRADEMSFSDQLWSQLWRNQTTRSTVKKPDNRVMWRSWSPPAGSVLKLICVQVPF